MVDLLFLHRQSTIVLVDAYIRARAHISKEIMIENDETVDPMRDAAPDVDHLRLEISENRDVFVIALLMLHSKEVFCFFQSGILEFRVAVEKI